VTPLYPQKLALTSPTGGGRSVGIVRSRTKATESYIRGPHIFYKSREHINIPGVRRVIRGKFHSGAAQTLGLIVQNLIVWATWDVRTPDISNP